MASADGTLILQDDGSDTLDDTGQDLLSDGSSDCDCCAVYVDGGTIIYYLDGIIANCQSGTYPGDFPRSNCKAQQATIDQMLGVTQFIPYFKYLSGGNQYRPSHTFTDSGVGGTGGAVVARQDSYAILPIQDVDFYGLPVTPIPDCSAFRATVTLDDMYWWNRCESAGTLGFSKNFKVVTYVDAIDGSGPTVGVLFANVKDVTTIPLTTTNIANDSSTYGGTDQTMGVGGNMVARRVTAKIGVTSVVASSGTITTALYEGLIPTYVVSGISSAGGTVTVNFLTQAGELGDQGWAVTIPGFVRYDLSTTPYTSYIDHPATVSPATGTGAGTITFTIAANATGSGRQIEAYHNGQKFTLNQN